MITGKQRGLSVLYIALVMRTRDINDYALVSESARFLNIQNSTQILPTFDFL